MSGPRRILLLLDYCGTSDALRMSFCIEAVRRAHPDAEIVLGVGADNLHLFDPSPHCDRVVPSRLYVRRRGPAFWRQAAKLLEFLRLRAWIGGGYDLVIVLGWGTSVLDVLGWTAGREVVGHPHRLAWMLSSNLPEWPAQHEDLEGECARMLASLGIPAAAARPARIDRDGEAAAVQTLLAEAGLLDGRPLALLHTGSDWACQQWLQERWAELGDRLVDRGASVVFTGVGNERAYVDVIRQRMRSSSTSFAGRTSLPEVQALLARCALCVTVDSGIADLSRGVGIPTVVLAGPSDARRPGDGPLTIAVNRTPGELREAITECRDLKFSQLHCLDYSCGMAGLRDLRVEDALEAVDRTGALQPARAGAAGS